jgi:TrmH family RNA methyltransferase
MKEILSTQHPLVKHWVKLTNDKNYRYSEKKVLVEGKKIVSELRNQKIRSLITDDESLIPKNINTEEVYLVTKQVIEKISTVKKSEGLFAEILMPPPQSIEDKNYIIVLDRINDPGNMGTLFRTALALGWEGVFILEGSCDPYNDKAMRAAKGAIFKLPFMIGSWDLLNSFISKYNWQALAADITGRKLSQIPQAKKRLLVLGNESQGLSLEALACCIKVTIPMNVEMESLNVSTAGAILMYQLGKEVY